MERWEAKTTKTYWRARGSEEPWSEFLGGESIGFAARVRAFSNSTVIIVLKRFSPRFVDVRFGAKKMLTVIVYASLVPRGAFGTVSTSPALFEAWLNSSDSIPSVFCLLRFYHTRGC